MPVLNIADLREQAKRRLPAVAFAYIDGGAEDEITLRANTERPETVTVGANVLCDSTADGALEAAVADMLGRAKTWTNPFGDGKAGERCADLLCDPNTRRLPSGAP